MARVGKNRLKEAIGGDVTRSCSCEHGATLAPDMDDDIAAACGQLITIGKTLKLFTKVSPQASKPLLA